jgi:hypothetical protein
MTLRVVVVAVAVVSLAAGCGGGGGAKTATNAASQPLRANDYTHNGDPDADPGSIPGANTRLSSDGKGHFVLHVQNESSFGRIDDLTWVPPPDLTITHVIATSKGSCGLAGANLQCSVDLPPPKCTCRPGPEVVIRFSGKTVRGAAGHSVGYAGGSLRIGGVTPVPYVIPSAPNPLSSTTPGE